MAIVKFDHIGHQVQDGWLMDINLFGHTFNQNLAKHRHTRMDEMVRQPGVPNS